MNITLKKNATIAAFIIICVSLLGSCKKDLATRENNSISPATTSTARSATSTFTSNEKIDVQIYVYISCANGGAGESVLLSGPLHILTSYTITGNSIRGKTHYQPQGIVGYGEITGKKYQATGGTQFNFNSSFVNGKYVETYINNFRIIGQGPGNNFLIHNNFHITINSNGSIKALVNNFSADCR